MDFEETYKNAIEVYDLIKDYFGENLTDSNRDEIESAFNEINDREDDSEIHYDPLTIIIKFPKVRVTNENDNYIDITNLFVKVSVNKEGNITEIFRMLRTEYTITQWMNNYSHSHILFSSSTPEKWLEPCLGTGPIKDTIHFLRGVFDIQRWGLFCFELSKYVTVESLTGGPYRRLENVGSGILENASSFYTKKIDAMCDSLLRIFSDYFIKKYDWKFSFNGNKYIIGEPLLNLWINISNAYIKWCNEGVTSGYLHNIEKLNNYLQEYYIKESMLYSPAAVSTMSCIENMQGKDLFVFKGEMQKLVITNVTDSPEEVKLISAAIRDYIITKVLTIINSNYGKKIRSGTRRYYL